ncbi:MAG: hypothetical protein JO189_05670 [Deltaproteobacteria bacterium]|nr:hypothetical protein [Deltaproteobacteria bacterium]
MSKRQGLASKLLAVLGGAGLAIGICAARASAQATLPPLPPPWSNANFANRYVCNATSGSGDATVGGNIFTGVMKINPNGAGKYTAGTLNASGSPFFPFSPNSVPTANFCSYSLNTAGSGYAVSPQGIGTDVLLWTLTSTNTACPPTFVEHDIFVIRNNVTANNTVPRTDFTSDNFLGLHGSVIAPRDPGHGYCLK